MGQDAQSVEEMVMLQIFQGHCLDRLRELPDESVQCCVTSPPYWTLRDYGIPPVQWPKVTFPPMAGLPEVSVPAETSAHGSEADLLAYVAHEVQIFREVRRVLKSDGVLWVNLGDAYTRNGGTNGGGNRELLHLEGKQRRMTKIPKALELGEKNLLGLPWRVAFALQAPYPKPRCIQAETDCAWLAALVDGEGCIGIRRQEGHSNALDGDRCQDGFIPFVGIGNNDQELLDRCVAITGFGKVGIKDRPRVDSRGIKSRRIYYGWRLDGNKALAVIRAIYPYLIAKKRQALLCHNLDLSNKAGREMRGKGPLPSSEQEKRELLKRLVNSCNQRDPVVLPDWLSEPEQEYEPGWTLRQDIIWAKPNPMPESVRDRCTKAHEYLFLFSKGERYYWDQEAIAEPVSGTANARVSKVAAAAIEERLAAGASPSESNPFCHGLNPKAALRMNGVASCSTLKETTALLVSQRNPRSVWTMASEPYSEAHFATFPTLLPKRCILASTRSGDTVLDPFAGSGTTGMVAIELGRSAILIEANHGYVDLIRQRTNVTPGLALE